MNPYFYVAHVKGHHKLVATHEDPASARRGENLYAFAIRSIIGQSRETWTFEAELIAPAAAGVHADDRVGFHTG
jgi:alkane 1-monooxygenase